MTSLDMSGAGQVQAKEPAAAKGFRIEKMGGWLMAAYWLAMLAILAVGASQPTG